MKPELWQQIEKIYHAALERTPAERSSFLDDACAGDAQLRREVTALLSYDDPNASFIESPALEVAARQLAAQSSGKVRQEPAATGNDAETAFDSSLGIAPLSAGQMLGSFRILRKIGQGGMGEVYLAEDTRLGRKVAVKLLAPDLVANRQAQARFLREARLASTLDHANICTVHEVGESAGRCFIAMQYIEGKTIKQILNGSPLPLDSLISISLQIADALALAHQQAIIHRDIKSNNILVTERGQVKILDFGLAKVLEKDDNAAEPDLTQTGMPLGTPSYMSPEQARGERVDHRSDIFSFGVVLYEMASGQTPFRRKSQTETMNAVIHQPHRPIVELNDEIPPVLSAIIDRLLPKEPCNRYQSMAEVVSDLRQAAHSLGVATASAPDGVLVPYVQPRQQNRLGSFWRWSKTRKSLTRRLAIIGIAVLLVAAIFGWLYRRNARLEWASASVGKVEELAGAEKYFEAYNLALEVKKYLPDNATLAHLMPVIADDLSVETEPSGAQVFLKHFTADQSGQIAARQLLGTSPINNLQIGRDDYIVEIEKEGYAPVQRSFSSALDRVQRAILGPAELRREVKVSETPSGGVSVSFDAYSPIRIREKLIPMAEAPERMAFIAGSNYRLVSYGKPTAATVQLDDYFIDKYEVSNRDYKEFINAGGYLKQQFWKHPFHKEGKELSWQEAIEHFKDRTGLAGPRSWLSQNFPEGKAHHPVTDITWYEAAAYAEFRGKQLPTVFQWEKAARNGAVTHYYYFIMPWGLSLAKERLGERANFLGSGTVAVENLEFGMSPYGCYNMAGNVAEWCRNRQADAFPTAGGSWGDPHYVYASFGAYPGFYSANTLGFRCVLNAVQASGDQGAMPLNPDKEIPTYSPTSESEFQTLLRHYQYDQTPLNPQIEEVTETEVWRREKISYAGAGGERAFAYLYLPKNLQLPVQVIHYVPTDAAYYGLTVPEEIEANAASYIKAGRAVFSVVLRGYKERPWPAGQSPPKNTSVQFRERVVNWATDHRRGLDYLSTRSDIDAGKIAAYAVSVNPRKLTLIAVESRYAAVILVGAGLIKSWSGMIPETYGANFAPHIRAPKLMLHGRYDEIVPYRTEGEPLYKLLREPKELFLFDQGHVPSLEISVPVINQWLDKRLGAVKRG